MWGYPVTKPIGVRREVCEEREDRVVTDVESRVSWQMGLLTGMETLGIEDD